MTQLPYTKRKFLSLSLSKQHLEMTKILRNLYENRDKKDLWSQYCDYASFLSLEVPYFPETPEEIANLFHFHIQKSQVELREDNLLPEISKGDKSQASPFLPIRIFLDNLRSAHNVGSIIRTTEAFRLGEIYCYGTTPPLEDPKVQRTSMGAYDKVKNYHSIPLKRIPGPLIALETSSEAIPVHEMIFPESFTLIVGNEEYGISEQHLQDADFLVQIPLVGCKNSLNVANAFAITAAEISRQRRKIVTS